MMRAYSLTIADKLANYTLEGDNGCIEWMGNRNKKGYGRTKYKGKAWLAHRLMYTELVGEIPEGMTLDHLCENPPCVNPAHLEPVTASENATRADYSKRVLSHCRKGHERSPGNVYKDGHCKKCKSDNRRKTLQKKGTE